MSIQDHLDDIDFRSKEVRSLSYKEEFIKWYDNLYNQLIKEYDDRLQAQFEILSAVLWHLLDNKEYKKLRKLK